MKLILLLLGVFYILVGEAREIPNANIDVTDGSVDSGKVNNFRDYKANHRRHKRQYSNMNPYSFQGFQIPSNYDNYQDIQIALLKDKLDSLIRENEIRSKINTSPQIVYVPVPFAVPLYKSCPPANHTSNDLSNRFNSPDEENELKKIWNSPEVYDGNRKISFQPKQPSRPVAEQPPVEHGTFQAGVTTEAPFAEPGPCDVAILICCKEKMLARKDCFYKNNCVKVFNTGLACQPKTIEEIINKFVMAYASDDA